jgi:predicted transcriptional regulator
MGREDVRDWISQENSGVHGQVEQRRTNLKFPRRKNNIRVGAIAIAKMLALVMEECYSVEEISEECGLAVQTIRRYMKELYKNKVIHIADWTEDVRGIRTVKVWGFGDKPDAEKPKRMTSKEACAKYRAKMKQIKLIQQMTGQNK